MSLYFTKMHGAGNDFVLLDGRKNVPAELGDVARAIGDRHMGVGFDQLLVVRDSESHPYHMEIWNSDGSLAEMCGNGIRCFAKWLFDHGELSSGLVTVETAGGPRRIEISGYVNGSFEAAVGMGIPDFEPSNIPMVATGPGSHAISGQTASHSQLPASLWAIPTPSVSRIRWTTSRSNRSGLSWSTIQPSQNA